MESVFFRIVSCGVVMLSCENKRKFRKDLLVSNNISDDRGGIHSKRSLNFSRLHSVTSKKAEFFIFIALITSSIASSNIYVFCYQNNKFKPEYLYQNSVTKLLDTEVALYALRISIL